MRQLAFREKLNCIQVKDWVCQKWTFSDKAFWNSYLDF